MISALGTIGGMNDFLTWPGWAGVSALAQLLALVTLLGAAWRFILQRRQMPLFSLDCEILGHRVVDDEGTRYHLVEFRNTGRGSAEIHMLEFVGALVRHEDGYLTPTVVMSGGTFRLLLTSPKIAEVWFRLTWRTPDSRRRATIAWWPLVRHGELYDRWVASSRRTQYLRRIRQALLPRPVAPGLESRAVYHAWPWENTHKLHAGPDKSAVYSLGTNHNFTPDEFPFVDTRPVPKPSS